MRQSNSARFTGLAGIILVLLVGMLVAGCGRKLFPKPSGEEAAPQVRDLQTLVTSRGVELSWTVPEGAAQNKFQYTITRSELNWENRNCLECPGAGQQVSYPVDPSSIAAALSTPDRKIQWLDAKTTVHHAYRYQIAMQDANEGKPVLSHPVLAKVFAGPPSPVGVSAGTQHQGILVQWKPVTKDPQGKNLQGDITFRVERSSPSKSWEKASPQVKGNSFLDQGVASEQSYSYRVVPVLVMENTPVMGEPSTAVMAKAPESVTPPPPNSVWVIPAKGALEVRWTESEGKIGGYHVYRREGKEIIRLTAGPVPHPPFVDQNVKRNAVYSYAVSAVSAQADHKEGLLSKWAEMRALLLE